MACHVPRSLSAAPVQAQRQKAREEVLLRLLRGDATGAQLRDDLAARCGGPRVVDTAREWLRANGLVQGAPHPKLPATLTPKGREFAAQVAERREKGRAA